MSKQSEAKKNVHLLLLEDNIVDQKSFLRFVKKNDLPYEVSVASSIVEFKNHTKKTDVIVSDFNLLDGCALDIIHPSLEIPIIVVTGEGNENTAVRSLRAGAFDYIVKDLHRKYFQIIPSIIDNALKHKDMQDLIKADEIEIKQKNEKLKDYNNKLKEASRAKSMFLANLSHEIRSPLSLIVGMCELLKNETDSQEIRKYHSILDKSAQGLFTLVNNILDFSKIEAGEVEFCRATFDLRDSLHEIIEVLSVRAAQKNIKLISKISENVPKYIIGDSGRLNQVIMNLLSNAVKFTNSGFVLLELTAELNGSSSRKIKFVVKDTGIGIAEDKLAHIFGEFSQENSMITKEYGGTGLGLAIAKEIVEKMGGNITVASKFGEGTVFSFALIFEEVYDAKVSKIEQIKGLNRPLRLLVTDDSADIRFLIGALLKHKNYILDFAENGQVALAKVKENTYDLILMDMQMPIMNGYQAIKEIRLWEKNSNNEYIVPIVALTGAATKEEREYVLAAGGTAFLTKPVKQKVLLETISKYGLKYSK